MTVRDLFGRQLMQIRQLTDEKALSIVSLYPTPIDLISAINQGLCMTHDATSQVAATVGPEREQLLHERTRHAKERSRVGPVLSRTVAQLYSQQDLV